MKQLGLLQWLFTAVLLVAVLPRAAEPQMALKKISLIPQWQPQAQFAGYYVAYETGIYSRYGIDLTILEGGPENPALSLLKEHSADFGTCWLSSALQCADSGLDLVNLAQVIQKSSLMFITKKSSGITKPEDMNGKKVSMWEGDFQILPQAFISKYDLNVRLLYQGQSVELFLRDAAEVASGMLYNEYHSILNSGLNPEELRPFFFYDYGLNFPEDGIYCLRETYERNPALCCNFVQASFEGWQYAFDHPELALDIVMKYMHQSHIGTNRPHQRWMLSRIKDLMHLDSLPQGQLGREDYLRVAEQLKAQGILRAFPRYEDFFKGCLKND